jgi:hypothetical protein
MMPILMIHSYEEFPLKKLKTPHTTENGTALGNTVTASFVNEIVDGLMLTINRLSSFFCKRELSEQN